MCPVSMDSAQTPSGLSVEISEASEVLFMLMLLLHDTEMEAALCHEIKFCLRHKAWASAFTATQ